MKLTDLRGILQYIPQFREKTFILTVGGALAQVTHDVAGRGDCFGVARQQVVV